MAKSFSIQFKGFDEYSKNVQNAATSLPILADLEASATAIDIERLAKQAAPVNLGNLRATINHEKISAGVYAIRVSADYAAYIEFGTKSRVQIPSGLEQYAAQFKGPGTGKGKAKDMIYAWCKSKGIPEEAWLWIYISIMVKGIKAQPFLFPAVRSQEKVFIDRIKKLLGDL